MAVQVVTTTLFNNPTASPIGSGVHSHSSVPIGAIVGGTIAGSALAVLVTVIWIYWGKQIQKTKRKQEEERDKNRKTRYNTLQNARISGPKSHSHRPLLRPPPPRDDKRVKFIGDQKALATQPPAGSVDPERAKHMLFDNPNTTPPRPAWLPAFSIRQTGSWPLPLKKLSQNSIRGTNSDDNNNGPKDPPSQPENKASSREVEKPIPHKASNVSAVSAQSNASRDSRHGRVPSSLILAALGGNASNRNSLRAGDRQSNASLWSHLLRAMPGTRSSQASYGESGHQPSEGDQTFPVGTAV